MELDSSLRSSSSSSSPAKVDVFLEVCMHPTSTASRTLLFDRISEFVRKNAHEFSRGEFDVSEDSFLHEHILSARVVDLPEDTCMLARNALIHIHIFQLSMDGPSEEIADEGENIPACQHWLLPAVEFHGMWESLYFDSNVKERLLRYANTTMLFSDRGVDPNLICWNRVILLHGPPGTGKTSLCKALAHKLSIRLSGRYAFGQLVEVNAHSLFSKWFSESGKLVMKLFGKIQELVEDEDTLVCVLIDEVESLTAARQSALSGSEPSDAIRVVNAVLTQIDKLKQYPNVLIFTTSNITGAIDLAFVDRADIKQYIGPPNDRGRYEILRSALLEFMRVGIVAEEHPIPSFDQHSSSEVGIALFDATMSCSGLSGRALRKLPFLAHAYSSVGSDVLTAENCARMFQKMASLEQASRDQLLGDDAMREKQ